MVVDQVVKNGIVFNSGRISNAGCSEVVPEATAKAWADLIKDMKKEWFKLLTSHHGNYSCSNLDISRHTCSSTLRTGQAICTRFGILLMYRIYR